MTTATKKLSDIVANKLGWLVIEGTSRDGCDVLTGPRQYWRRADAEADAKATRLAHADDDCYGVEVRRETAEDAARYGNYAS